MRIENPTCHFKKTKTSLFRHNRPSYVLKLLQLLSSLVLLLLVCRFLVHIAAIITLSDHTIWQRWKRKKEIITTLLYPALLWTPFIFFFSSRVSNFRFNIWCLPAIWVVSFLHVQFMFFCAFVFFSCDCTTYASLFFFSISISLSFSLISPFFSYIIFETCYLASYSFFLRVSSLLRFWLHYLASFLRYNLYFHHMFTKCVHFLYKPSFDWRMHLQESIPFTLYPPVLLQLNSIVFMLIPLLSVPISVGRTTPFQWRKKPLSNPNDPHKSPYFCLVHFWRNKRAEYYENESKWSMFLKTPTATLIGEANERSIWGVSIDFGSLW